MKKNLFLITGKNEAIEIASTKTKDENKPWLVTATAWELKKGSKVHRPRNDRKFKQGD